ncbi:hypothetical protein Sjap_005603 [Stephania japonica]|uniref:Uncharacterized protein n=1 Tax=Stephania japonica TaxID=461633 RepID=A0AAP0K5G8_9MAGN
MAKFSLLFVFLILEFCRVFAMLSISIIRFGHDLVKYFWISIVCLVWTKKSE